MVYKRGKFYSYKFRFDGQIIRASAKTTSKTVAREAEHARRRELELSVNRITKRERLPLFGTAAKAWLESKTALTALGRAYYAQYIGKLTRQFGSRLVSDITADDIAALQRKRQAEGLSGRQINCEVATLRTILKHFGLWLAIAHRVKMASRAKRYWPCALGRRGDQTARCNRAKCIVSAVPVFHSLPRRGAATIRDSCPQAPRLKPCLAQRRHR